MYEYPKWYKIGHEQIGKKLPIFKVVKITLRNPRSPRGPWACGPVGIKASEFAEKDHLSPM